MFIYILLNRHKLYQKIGSNYKIWEVKRGVLMRVINEVKLMKLVLVN